MKEITGAIVISDLGEKVVVLDIEEGGETFIGYSLLDRRFRAGYRCDHWKPTGERVEAVRFWAV